METALHTLEGSWTNCPDWSPDGSKIARKDEQGYTSWSVWEGEDVAPMFSELQRAWELQVAESGPVQWVCGEPLSDAFYVRYINPIDSTGYTRRWIEEKTNPELHALLTRLSDVQTSK